MGKTLGIILQVAAIVAFAATGNFVAAAITAATLTVSLLVKPDLPSIDTGKTNIRENVQARKRGYGIARIGGQIVFEETNDGDMDQVLLLHQGRISAVTGYYLNGEGVTDINDAGEVQDPEHYGGRVRLNYRLGDTPENAYGDIVSNYPDLWSDDHRGDGVGSIAMHCGGVKAKKVTKVYPNGWPELNVVVKLSPVFDPRDNAQSADDPSTWAWSANPVLGLMDYLTSEEGMRLDRATVITPALDEWIAAANVCDEMVARKDGTTEPRYESHLIYNLDNRAGDVVSAFVQTFDGWIYERADGAQGIKAGVYSAPTVTIPARHILEVSIEQYRSVDEAVNELRFKYTSPAHDYTEQEGDPWRHEDDITARGVTLSKQIDLTRVHSHAQGRRLAKREMIRQNAAKWGTVRTTVYGLIARGERWINLDLGEEGFGILAVEVTSYVEDMERACVTIGWRLADPNIDAWDPDTEEGVAPPVVEKIDGDDVTVTTPANLTISSEAVKVNGSTNGARLRFEFDGDPDKLDFEVRYRAVGTTSWTTEDVDDDEVNDGHVVHRTGIVDDDQTYEGEAVAYTSNGTYSDWTDARQVTSDAGQAVSATRITSTGATRVTSDGLERVS